MSEHQLNRFLQLSEQGQEQLAGAVQVLEVGKHSIPIHKGDKVSGAYVVTRGCLRVFAYTPNGNESTFYLIRPGETCVFAINCLFNQLLYPAWVSAEEDTEVCVIRGDKFRALFQHEPSVQNLTIDALSSAVFKLMTQVEQLQGWSVAQRLTHLLLNQANDAGQVLMTQQELAGRLGTTREVVARSLSEMAASGWITTGRGKLTLRNISAMAQTLS